MELLVLLLALIAINVALWLGWGADSRNNESWDPSGLRLRAQRRSGHLRQARVHLGGRDSHVVPR